MSARGAVGAAGTSNVTVCPSRPSVTAGAVHARRHMAPSATSSWLASRSTAYATSSRYSPRRKPCGSSSVTRATRGANQATCAVDRLPSAPTMTTSGRSSACSSSPTTSKVRSAPEVTCHCSACVTSARPSAPTARRTSSWSRCASLPAAKPVVAAPRKHDDNPIRAKSFPTDRRLVSLVTPLAYIAAERRTKKAAASLPLRQGGTRRDGRQHWAPRADRRSAAFPATHRRPISGDPRGSR